MAALLAHTALIWLLLLLLRTVHSHDSQRSNSSSNVLVAVRDHSNPQKSLELKALDICEVRRDAMGSFHEGLL